MKTAPIGNCLVFVFVWALSMLTSVVCKAQLTITPGATASQLIQSFAGQGITVSNLTINCRTTAYGTFQNSGGNLPMSDGILLTSGLAASAAGPNNTGGRSFCHSSTTQFNDPQLLSIDNRAFRDVCIIEFDIIPQCNSLQVRFVFGSEEYPEFVSSSFNDAFGFFITGPGPNCGGAAYNNTNVATLPNNVTPVTIDNVNAGNNNSFYVANPSSSSLQYDGLTTLLTRTVTLCPCASYHFKIAIADAWDCAYDSGVFVDLIQCSNPVNAAPTAVAPTCGCTGSASANATGGLPPYTYLWSNGANTATINNVCPGNYTVTVSDQLACTTPRTFNVTVPNGVGNLSLSPSQSNVTCFGGNNGTATATPSGAAGPYTYSWSPGGQTSQTATNLAAGNYTVSVTSGTGCTQTASYTITEPPQLTATQSQVNVTCQGQCNGSATVTPSGGTGTYTYIWSPGGQTTQTASNLCAGNYTCTITSGTGCTITKSFTITAPTALSATPTQVNPTCFGTCNGTATVSPTGGTSPYSFQWSNGAGSASAANGLCHGSYTCMVTDAAGCSVTVPFSIIQPSQLTANQSQTDVQCFGGCDGTATVSNVSGGTGAYNYSWSPSGGNAASAVGLCVGTYTATISDANGCQITKSYTIAQPTQLSATTSSSAVSCFGGNDGSASVTPNGGTAPYSYAWTPQGGSSQTANGLSFGSYSVIVSDANGCNAQATATVGQPAMFEVNVVSGSDVSCFGGNDGTATAAAVGGMPPYTYSWTNGGGNNATGTGFGAGTYTVTATDVNGCAATATATIGQPTALVSSILTSLDVSCFGGNDGNATAAASGGIPPYTFAWDNGQNLALATGLAAATYNVTVSDNNGCQSNTSAVINEPTQVGVVVNSITDVSCFGGNDGTAAATGNGGTPPYSYVWDNGVSGSAGSGFNAGNHSVTITDANGCVSSQVFTVNEPTQLSAIISAFTDATCFGYADGTATVSPSGGVTPYSFAWASGTNQANESNLPAGTHNVTVSDANNCTVSVNAIIGEPSVFSVAISGTTIVSCFGGNNGTATANASGGTNPVSYLWSNGNNGITASQLPAGNVDVTATDNNGCIATASAMIDEPDAVAVTITSTENVLCNGGSNGTASLSVAGGTPPYTNVWSNGQSNTITATNLSAGNYTTTVTDFNGCTGTASFTISEPPPLAASASVTQQVSCFGGNDAEANASASGGTAPYLFNWSSGSTAASASNLSAQAYDVIVTDNNGCQVMASIVPTEPSQLQITISQQTDPTCFGYADGTATALASGGSIPYVFNWSSGGTNAQEFNLPAGTHFVSVTDQNGCNASTQASLSEPSLFQVSISQIDHVSCNGLSDGVMLTQTIGGVTPYTYLWSNGSTLDNASSLTAGNYTLTATDANGCQSMVSADVLEPTPLVAVIDNTSNVSCFGGSDGSASALVSGGTPPYVSVWSNASSGLSINMLTAGTYDLLVSDAQNCTTQATLAITEPQALTASVLNTTDITCYGANDGFALLDATGGTPPYSFEWPDGSQQNPHTQLPSGTHIVQVTDAANCATTATVTIADATPFEITNTIVTDVSCSGLSNGAIDITISGGSLPYSYSWSDASISEDIVNKTAGDYTVTASDANGCMVSVTATINQPTELEISVTSIDASCHSFSDGEITAVVAGGTTPYSYAWSFGNFQENATGLAAGNYSVTVSDANNCSISANANINQPEPLLIEISGVNPTCNGLTNGSAEIIVTGGITPYQILWTSGSTALTQTGIGSGNYTAAVTDANGCQQQASIVLSEPPPIEVTIAAEEEVLSMVEFELSANVDGGTPNYTYVWEPADLGDCIVCKSLNAKMALTGNVMVTVTDANGCVAYDTATIIIGENLIWLPNAFSPNDDNKNEVFKAYAPPGIEEFELLIYTRWGEQIYRTKDINAGWDGSYKGVIKTDVYVYTVRAKFPNGKVKTLNGTFQLL